MAILVVGIVIGAAALTLAARGCGEEETRTCMQPCRFVTCRPCWKSYKKAIAGCVEFCKYGKGHKLPHMCDHGHHWS